MRSRKHWLSRLLVGGPGRLTGAASLAALAGCGSLEPAAPYRPITDRTQLYTRLTLDHPAVTMSTAPGYNTLQLTATPRDANGDPMPDLPAPVFASPDTTKVHVTPEGLLTAVAPVTDFEVTATLTVGPVTRADTVRLNVTTLAPPPKLASLSIQPVPPASAVLSISPPSVNSFATNLMGIFKLLPPPPRFLGLRARAVDSFGNAMDGLQVEYMSLNPAVAPMSDIGNDIGGSGRRSGLFLPIRTGEVRFVARTMAYGITAADTVKYTVVPPAAGDFIVRSRADGQLTFQPQEIRIAPGALVIWTNTSSDEVDVTFDGPDPTQGQLPPEAVCTFFAEDWAFLFGPGPVCGVGDVLVPPIGEARPDLGMDGTELTTRVRYFPAEGVYSYRSTRTGATGRIVVSTQYGN